MIVYDPHTNRYAMILHETIIGYARTRHEAEAELVNLEHFLADRAITSGACKGNDAAGMTAFAAAYVEQVIKPRALGSPIASTYEPFGTLDNRVIQGLRSRFTNERLGVVAVDSAEMDGWRLVADDLAYVSITDNAHTVLPSTRIVNVAGLRNFLQGDALLHLLVAAFAWAEDETTPPTRSVDWENVHP